MVTYLRDRPWPGNVRELENTIERAVILCDGETLTEAELVRDDSAGDGEAQGEAQAEAPLSSLADARRAFERQYLTRMLAVSGGRIDAAAKIAGMTRASLRRLLRRHGLGEVE